MRNVPVSALLVSNLHVLWEQLRWLDTHVKRRTPQPPARGR
jgi:hypothetical protein